MPRALTRTVAPSFAFVALLTFTTWVTVEAWVGVETCGAGAGDAAERVLLFELLPQAASRADSANVGIRTFADCRILDPFG
jgi:hypothetical protein